MKKLASLDKSSFALIETLLSLIIISVILSGFTKFINNPTKLSNYQSLQKSHNSFSKIGVVEDYDNFSFQK